MRILFCNDRYPGRFGKIPSELAADPANKVMFLSFHPKQEDASSGIIHARLNLNRNRERITRDSDSFVSEWEKMFNLGKQALRTFLHIREAGFLPDMIFTSLFDGPGLFLRHAFPEAYIVSYFNGFRSKSADDGRLKAVLEFQKTMAVQSDLYFVRSDLQKHSFPPVLRPLIHLWPPYVDTEFFHPISPNISLFFPDLPPSPYTELVTGHMKGTAGSQTKLIQVILDLLRGRPHCLAALTFENATSQGRWQQLLKDIPATLHQRLFLAGGLDSSTYHQLLCSSSVYVFPEYANPPLQGMLETMSCETLLMAPVSQETDDLLLPGETMLVYPEGDRQKQREAICHVLDRPTEYVPIRLQARKRIETTCSDRVVFSDHLDLVMREYGQFKNRK